MIIAIVRGSIASCSVVVLVFKVARTAGWLGRPGSSVRRTARAKARILRQAKKAREAADRAS
jgi:hypothetical protein